MSILRLQQLDNKYSFLLPFFLTFYIYYIIIFIIFQKGNNCQDILVKQTTFNFNKAMKGVEIMPNNKYSTVSVRLTEEEKTELENYSIQNDLSQSQVIRKALKEFLNK